MCAECQWHDREKKRCSMWPQDRRTGLQRAIHSWQMGQGGDKCPGFKPRPLV